MKLKFDTENNGAQADPFMCEVEGGWAMYVTGKEGVRAYFSDSPFGTWKYKGIVCQKEGYEEYWAPCIISLDGWYYLYFSCSTDDMYEHLHVAKSQNPFGPFTDMRCLYPYFSIDAHVVQTEAGLFLWYATNKLHCERVGTRVCVERLLDPYTPSGHPVEMVSPTLDEEIYMKDRYYEGEHWHTIEGAFWLSHEGYQYVMYSGACYQNDTYHIGYAVAKSDEQDLTKVVFTKHTENGQFAPLLTKNEYEEGVGHHSVICYEGDYYAVYHGRDITNACNDMRDRRTARICKLKFQNGHICAERE